MVLVVLNNCHVAPIGREPQIIIGGCLEEVVGESFEITPMTGSSSRYRRTQQ